jgi:predicted AlkP superfamily phosphohydrolase/phosphomutase
MRALIIVAEGVDPGVLAQEVSSGRLPWFAQQMRRQNYHPLDCGPVPYEPSNLATAFTGVNPGRHGCFSYWSTHSAGELPRVLETDDVKMKRVWEWEELSDLRFNVVNVQLTHPPKPLNGALITYPMQKSLNTSFPRSLLSDLHLRGIRYAHDVTLFYRGEPFEDFAREAWRVATAQLETALELAKDTDVLIVNLTLADRLSHFLWYQMKACSEGERPAILRGYEFIDEACRRLQAVGADSTLVFSEIGFGELDSFVSIDTRLQEAGLQVLTPNGEVDVQRSVAMETVQGSHGVMLREDLCNEGRAGTAAIETVRQFLADMKFSDGTPVLAAIRHRDELYQGPYRHLAPTLVVRPADDKRPPLGERRWAGHVRRTAQSGWHRDQGFLIVDSSFACNDFLPPVQLQQIAPTIAHLLGCEPARQCEMRSLLQ